MEIQIQTYPVQEQLPQIRRITKLEDIRKTVPPQREIKLPQRPKYSLRFFIIGLLFFGILGFELTVIYRYGQLNKRLYRISVNLKNRVAVLQDKLQDTNNIKDKLVTSRRALVRNYLDIDSQYRILQFRMDDYRDISLAKSSKIDLLKGDLAVAYAQIEAVKVQNELLAEELKDKGGYIRELTTKLINNIGEQKLLVNENVQLKGEIETLKKQVVAPPVEAKDVN